MAERKGDVTHMLFVKGGRRVMRLHDRKKGSVTHFLFVMT